MSDLEQKTFERIGQATKAGERVGNPLFGKVAQRLARDDARWRRARLGRRRRLGPVATRAPARAPPVALERRAGAAAGVVGFGGQGRSGDPRRRPGGAQPAGADRAKRRWRGGERNPGARRPGGGGRSGAAARGSDALCGQSWAKPGFRKWRSRPGPSACGRSSRAAASTRPWSWSARHRPSWPKSAACSSRAGPRSAPRFRSPRASCCSAGKSSPRPSRGATRPPAA